MKYLIAASVDLGVTLLIRMGAILIKLSSSPSQAENQEADDTLKIVPTIKVGKKINIFDLIIIKKKNQEVL